MSNSLFPRKSDTDYQPPKGGRLHFSKDMERKIFFFLTVAMLLMGILCKTGIW